VDTTESSAPHAHPSTEEQNHPDEAPHVCNDGWVTLGQIAIDPETARRRRNTRFTSAAGALSKAKRGFR
jgi:hypothetical protein